METTQAKPLLPIIQYYVLPQLFLCFVVAVRPNFLGRLLAFCLVSYWNLAGTTFTTGRGILADYGQGEAFAWNIFNAIHLLFLTNPTSDFHHESDDFTSARDLPLFRRIYWLLSALYNMRGIGWNFQVLVTNLLFSHPNLTLL